MFNLKGTKGYTMVLKELLKELFSLSSEDHICINLAGYADNEKEKVLFSHL